MDENQGIAETTQPEPVIAKPFPRLWVATGWIVTFFLLQFVGGAIAVFAVAWDELAKGDTAAVFAKMADIKTIALPTLWSLVGSSIVMILLLWRYLRKDDRFRKLGLDRWSELSLIRTILLSAGLIALGLCFNYAYTAYVIPDVKMQDDLRRLFEAIPKTALNSALLLVAVAVLAPITEELLFRGLLQRSLVQVRLRFFCWKFRLGAAGAIVIASAVFAAVHMDVYAFPALFALGAVFGYLYHKTGSLRVNIIMHLINNAAALLLT